MEEAGVWCRFLSSDSKHKDKSFRDRMDMFFYDTDLMPLFVQENYIKVCWRAPPLSPSRGGGGGGHSRRSSSRSSSSLIAVVIVLL